MNFQNNSYLSEDPVFSNPDISHFDFSSGTYVQVAIYNLIFLVALVENFQHNENML